ncbi:MAG: P-II family nitrogen regulator [Clostridia bacterium]|nr:P-II family nitrogen regulator [Clostridia bacterium]
MHHALLSLLVTIVDRGKAESVTALLSREGANNHTVALGRGTAHKGILSLLGLKDTDKDVVFSFLPSQVAAGALRRLSYAVDMDRPGKGIAFVVPVGSVGGAATLKMLSGDDIQPQGEEKKEMDPYQHELVVAIMNKGFSETAMEAARPAGAGGGTVIHARGAAPQEGSHFFGITIQPEKEMLLIVVEKENKVPVMQAVCRAAGLQTEGHGIVFSLPVTELMGISRKGEREEMDV